MIFNKEEDENYKNSDKTCHFCEKEFTLKDPPVRDHCHFTGRFRGAAHNSCNLTCKNQS